MHTLLPRRGHNCQVGHVAISSLGRILVYTEDKQARSKVSWQSRSHHLKSLHVMSAVPVACNVCSTCSGYISSLTTEYNIIYTIIIYK